MRYAALSGGDSPLRPWPLWVPRSRTADGARFGTIDESRGVIAEPAADGRAEAAAPGRWHNPAGMKFLRMKPGHGEVLIAEGDVEVEEDEEALVAEFRRQLDQGMWAAVPTTGGGGRRGAEIVNAVG